MVQVQKSPRSSNLELLRIVCMLMIIAHHYVVHSGLRDPNGPITLYPDSISSLFLVTFAAWGKTAINCFLMITGYFMCKSQITIRKFLKLLLVIYFYKIVIFFIFLNVGYESVTPIRLAQLVLPFWSLKNAFIGGYLVFFLTIPFWNILIRNMTQRQHLQLMLLLLGCYSVLGLIPAFDVRYNYVTWFGIIYIIASYIRIYPHPFFERKSLWGWLTLSSVILSIASVLFMHLFFNRSFYFLIDCHKLLAVVVAVCTFLWFKNLNLGYNKVINALGAATFGVFLIHNNSHAMYRWLWKDIVDCVGHYYSFDTGLYIIYTIGVVLAIFIVCYLIDQLRISTIEKWFFNWYDRNFSDKSDRFVNKYPYLPKS